MLGVTPIYGAEYILARTGLYVSSFTMMTAGKCHAENPSTVRNAFWRYDSGEIGRMGFTQSISIVGVHKQMHKSARTFNSAKDYTSFAALKFQPNGSFMLAVGPVTLYSDADPTATMTAASTAVQEFAIELAAKIQRDIVPSQIVAALSVAGVYGVTLTSPVLTPLAAGQWANCTTISLTTAFSTEHS
jgi:hypothetical protein